MAARKPKTHGESRALRELRYALVCLAIGAAGLPLLVYLVGRVMFGQYGNGGPFALWADYARALVSGSLSAWILLLAPLAAFWFARLARKLVPNRR